MIRRAITQDDDPPLEFVMNLKLIEALRFFIRGGRGEQRSSVLDAHCLEAVWIVDTLATGTDDHVDYVMQVSPEIIRLAEGEHKVMAEYAVHALGTMAASLDRVRDALLAQGAFAAIMRSAYQRPISLASTCLWALTNMMRGPGLEPRTILELDVVALCLFWLRPAAAHSAGASGSDGVTMSRAAAERAAMAGVAFKQGAGAGAGAAASESKEGGSGAGSHASGPVDETIGAEAAQLLAMIVQVHDDVLKQFINKGGLRLAGNALFHARTSRMAAPLLTVVGNSCGVTSHHAPTEAVAAVPSIMRSVRGILTGDHPAAKAAEESSRRPTGAGQAGPVPSLDRSVPQGPGSSSVNARGLVGGASAPVDVIALKQQAMWVVANLVSPPGRGEQHAKFFVEGGVLPHLLDMADGTFALAVESLICLTQVAFARDTKEASPVAGWAKETSLGVGCSKLDKVAEGAMVDARGRFVVHPPGKYFDAVAELPGFVGVVVRRVLAKRVQVVYQSVAFLHTICKHRPGLVPVVLESRGLEHLGDLADSPASSNPADSMHGAALAARWMVEKYLDPSGDEIEAGMAMGHGDGMQDGDEDEDEDEAEESMADFFARQGGVGASAAQPGGGAVPMGGYGRRGDSMGPRGVSLRPAWMDAGGGVGMGAGMGSSTASGHGMGAGMGAG